MSVVLMRGLLTLIFYTCFVVINDLFVLLYFSIALESGIVTSSNKEVRSGWSVHIA